MPENNRDIAREQIFNFLQISNDVYRNQIDARFADRENEIIYCLDSSIINLFFDAWQWRHAVSISAFYSPLFAPRESRTQWERIEAQSAIIAAEYLLSEDLPAAKNRNIYLTPWHLYEVAERAQATADDLEKRKYPDQLLVSEVEAKLAIFNRERLPERFLNPTVERDIADYRRNVPDDAAVARYERTRRAASVLVDCQASERLDQVHRLLSGPMVNRLSGIHTLFSASSSQLRKISSEAQMWFYRIGAEVARLPTQRSQRRAPKAIWNDARSLAFVSWIAREQLRSDQRIVFVTGDQTLFDAYRRWWVDAGQSAERGEEPFVVRRSFQYTPIFNLSDSRNDLSGTPGVRGEIQRLFSRVRDAIEVTLLPFNLSSMGDLGRRRSEYSRLRGREFLALRAKEIRQGAKDDAVEFFTKNLSDDWFKTQSEMLNDIAELWHKTERVGIGFFHDQILKRLEDDCSLYGHDMISGEARGTGKAALAYISKALDALAGRTRSVWLPEAIKFLSDCEQRESIDGARVPGTYSYELPSGENIHEFLHDWARSGGKDRAAMTQRIEAAPEAVFMLAATFALRSAEWWKAEEFSEYAVSSRGDNNSDDPGYWEAVFVGAIAKRFSLGDIGAHLQRSIGKERVLAMRGALDSAQGSFEEARGLIDYCVDTTPGYSRSPLNSLARLRALSERAALFLFFAASLGLSPKSLRGHGDEERVAGLINAAESDLLSCLAWKSPGIPDGWRDVEKAVTDQFLHNCVAAVVLRYVLEVGGSKVAALAADRVGLHRKSSSLDPISRVEDYAYCILTGRVSGFSWPDFEAAISEGSSAELALDRAICVAIESKKETLFRLMLRSER